MTGPEASGDALQRIAYDELRRLAGGALARGAPAGSLQATALVHEAWLRLAEARDFDARDSQHFLAAAAQAMRWVATDHARRRRAARLGTVLQEGLAGAEAAQDDALLALDEGLDRLERAYPDEARVVLHRYFAGLGVEETAEALGVSPATVKRRWAFARAWLARELDSTESGDS